MTHTHAAAIASEQQQAIRTALTHYPDGLTIAELVTVTGYPRPAIVRSVSAMRGSLRESRRHITDHPAVPSKRPVLSIYRLHKGYGHDPTP